MPGYGQRLIGEMFLWHIFIFQMEIPRWANNVDPDQMPQIWVSLFASVPFYGLIFPKLKWK